MSVSLDGRRARVVTPGPRSLAGPRTGASQTTPPRGGLRRPFRGRRRRGCRPTRCAAPQPQHPGRSALDLCLLGVGEEGHVASIFPDSAAARETGRLAVAVHGCPKPPPTRISLTLEAIRQADEVWLMTTGAGKAEAVAAALEPGARELIVPASGARGRTGTMWFLDTAASALLPV